MRSKSASLEATAATQTGAPQGAEKRHIRALFAVSFSMAARAPAELPGSVTGIFHAAGACGALVFARGIDDGVHRRLVREIDLMETSPTSAERAD